MMRILDSLGVYTCPHSGKVQVATTNTRVKSEGARFLLRLSDVFVIVGCTSTPPCLTVQWSNESKRVKIMGVPVLLETSIGACLNALGIPQGIVLIVSPQSSAKAL